MNTSSDAAEQIVRLSLEGFEVAAKITGHGSKDVAALLYAVMRDKKKTAGKTHLSSMLKSGKELKVFSVKQNDFKKFTEVAKKYGVLYCAITPKKDRTSDGVIDIMVRAEDAAKINRIVKRFNLSNYDDVAIRSEIENSKKEKQEKKIDIKNKDRVKLDDEEKNLKPIKKEKASLNLRLAKIEKSPLSEPSLEMQKSSEVGTKIKNKPSVKVKLEKAKQKVKNREKSKNKSDISKSKKVLKKKDRE